MKTFVSLLRGINVSGQKMIKMPALKAMYEALGFTGVQTYIQSGNVVFSTAEKDPAAIIRAGIAKTFGHDVIVLVRDRHALAASLAANPFLHEKELQEDKLYIAFMDASPSPALVQQVLASETPSDRFHIAENEIYMYFPGGYGNAKLNNNFFERKLKVNATTRNWKTANQLLKMLDAHE